MNISATSSMSASLYGTDSSDLKARRPKGDGATGVKNDHRGGQTANVSTFRNDIAGQSLVSHIGSGSSFKNDIAGQSLVSSIGPGSSFKNDIAGQSLVSDLSSSDSSSFDAGGIDFMA